MSQTAAHLVDRGPAAPPLFVTPVVPVVQHVIKHVLLEQVNA